MYNHAHLYIWKNKESTLLSHCEFQKMVAIHLTTQRNTLYSQLQLKRRYGDVDSDAATLPAK